MASIMNFVCEKYGGVYKNIIYSIPGPNGDVFKDIITLHPSISSIPEAEPEADPEPEPESEPTNPIPGSGTRFGRNQKHHLPKSARKQYVTRKCKSTIKRTGHMITDE